MSDHSPCLPSQDEGDKRPKRRYAGGESMTESREHLNQWKRGNCAVVCGGKEIETDMRHVLHRKERIIYSSSDSVWGSGMMPKLRRRERLVYSRISNVCGSSELWMQRYHSFTNQLFVWRWRSSIWGWSHYRLWDTVPALRSFLGWRWNPAVLSVHIATKISTFQSSTPLLITCIQMSPLNYRWVSFSTNWYWYPLHHEVKSLSKNCFCQYMYYVAFVDKQHSVSALCWPNW